MKVRIELDWIEKTPYSQGHWELNHWPESNSLEHWNQLFPKVHSSEFLTEEGIVLDGRRESQETFSRLVDMDLPDRTQLSH